MRCALVVIASLVPVTGAAEPVPNDRQLTDPELEELARLASVQPPTAPWLASCGSAGQTGWCGCVIPVPHGSFGPLLAAAAGSTVEPPAAEGKFGGQRPQVQLDLGLAVIGADFEHPLTRHLAVQLGAQVFSTYFAPWFDVGDKVMGFGGEVRATWFRRTDGRGFYVAPFFRLARVTGERDGESDSGVGFSAGAFAGWAFGLTRKLDLRLGAGAQYMRYRTTPSTGPVEIESPFVALDAVVGYRL